MGYLGYFQLKYWHTFYHFMPQVINLPLINQYCYKNLRFQNILKGFLFGFGIWILAANIYWFSHHASVVLGLGFFASYSIFLFVSNIATCKSSYIDSEKAKKFCENFPLLLSYVVQSKVRGRFQKCLWPSQNIWTLTVLNTYLIKAKLHI